MDAARSEVAVLQKIYAEIVDFVPSPTSAIPVLDSSVDFAEEGKDLLRRDHVPGLKSFRESVKRDLDTLLEFVDDPESVNRPPLSTNTPYVVAVWNEVLSAPPPIIALFKSVSLEPQRKADRNPSKSSTAKVDVIADNGKKWIRINTLKNARLSSEFREIDSYLTDSEGESDDENSRPKLAQSEFDNSVLRMGRDLMQAARANPIRGSEEIPEVILRLTRLDPTEQGADPRIAKTVQCLIGMGVKVELGECLPQPSPLASIPLLQTSPPIIVPTTRINLDLSILIALVSDLTHAPLPTTSVDAQIRFIPSKEYHDWKKQRAVNGGKACPTEQQVDLDLSTHSRALANQCLQEMGKGIIQEIRDRIAGHPNGSTEFWTTTEARDRCLRIVSKIGGEHEKRRLRALFPRDCAPLPEVSEDEDVEELYWRDSRFASGFLPLLPIRLFDPTGSTSYPTSSSSSQPHPFFTALTQTCRSLLAQEAMPHPRPPSESSEIRRATVMKANPKLTTHTVQSLLIGAELGWTTLTANKTSVKAILREVGFSQSSIDMGSDDASALQQDGGGNSVLSAAIWITDPRSLAEGMRSDLAT